MAVGSLMSAPTSASAGQFVAFEQRPDGLYVVVKPGGSTIGFEDVLALALATIAPAVDIAALKAAWERSDSTAVAVTPSPSSGDRAGRGVRAGEPRRAAAVASPAATLAPLSRDIVRQRFNRSRHADANRVPHASAPASSVLLVAAELRALAAAATILASRGLEIHRSSDVEAALSRAAQHRPDVVIVDVSVGTTAALEACRRIALDSRTTAIPTIVSCREATRQLVSEALAAGARDLMVHPISAEVLVRKLTKVLDGVGKHLPRRTDADAKSDGPDESVDPIGVIDVSKLLDRATELHAIPAVVERVMRISADVDAGAQELAQAVSMDAAATALVVQVANSAAYAAAKKTYNLADAVQRIGFKQTRSLVVGKSVMGSFGPKTLSTGFDRAACWRHSLATAIFAQQIAEHCREVPRDMAFTAGLLHDVGLVLLDEFCTSEFEDAVHTSLQERIPLSDAERRVLKTTHEEVAVHALRLWKFPDEIIEAAKFHHGVGDSGGLSAAHQAFCGTIHAADLMARARGIGHGGDTYIAEIGDDVWSSLNLGSGLPAGFWTHFEAEFKECHAFLGVPYEQALGYVADRGVALLCDEDSAPVSALGIAIESIGWKVVTAPTTGTLPKTSPSPAPAVVVVRGRSVEAIDASLTAWESVVGGAPIIAVLAAGTAAPEGRGWLSEPYDRDELLKRLPQATPPTA